LAVPVWAGLAVRGDSPGWGWFLQGIATTLLWPLADLLLLAPQRRAVDRDENRPIRGSPGDGRSPQPRTRAAPAQAAARRRDAFRDGLLRPAGRALRLASGASLRGLPRAGRGQPDLAAAGAAVARADLRPQRRAARRERVRLHAGA